MLERIVHSESCPFVFTFFCFGWSQTVFPYDSCRFARNQTDFQFRFQLNRILVKAIGLCFFFRLLRLYIWLLEISLEEKKKFLKIFISGNLLHKR